MKHWRLFLIAGISGCMAMAGRAQGSAWKAVKVGTIALKYPPNWQVDSSGSGEQVGVTLTPDSLRDLNMRMCVIFRLSADSSHDYGYLKTNFTSLVESSIGPDAYFLRLADTTLKNHPAVYAEATLRALPMKIYGFGDEGYNYVILFTERRNWQVADPRLVRDEVAILNSVNFGH